MKGVLLATAEDCIEVPSRELSINFCVYDSVASVNEIRRKLVLTLTYMFNSFQARMF